MFKFLPLHPMNGKEMIRYFKEDITSIPLPNKFTYPFFYQAHPLVKIAAHQVQKELERGIPNHNFGLIPNQPGLIIGKMFGVLVVQDTSDQIGFIAAFSGKLADSNHHKGFVPPVFDMLENNSYFKQEEAELSKLTHTIETLENNSKLIQAQEALKNIHHQFLDDIKRLRSEIKANKAERNLIRSNFSTLEPEIQTKISKELAQASINEQYTLKNAQRFWTHKINAAETTLTAFLTPIEKLKNERKSRSGALQQRLFTDYTFLNAKNELRSLLSIFSAFKSILPPAGAGECAAPKLLHFAYKYQLKPIAMGEFWWGASPKSEVRKHAQFYPACRGKCEPILSHMLQGLKVEENPMLENPAKTIPFDIVYEDAFLLVINKPPELLTVPGINVRDSVLIRAQALYPEATGPLIVHRLDMSTSGLLLLAKDKEVHRLLQYQFLKRSISKRYEALLDGKLKVDSGVINLPLRVDLDNRPQQLVCYEYGKKALTHWELVKEINGKTLVNLYPITGRTHQLRVHCAHADGLQTPIIGDDLYGTQSDRLYLHAAYLKFEHPITKAPIELYQASGFDNTKRD